MDGFMTNSGFRLPAFGYGTYPLTDAEAEVRVEQAIAAGYRLIDTAENYRNEVGVGAGVRAAGVPDVMVCTKFNANWHGQERVLQAAAASLKRLGLERLDMLLIHWPNPQQDRYVDAWKGLIRAREEGLTRGIGVSNFKPAHLDRIIDATGVAPDVNQIECHPLLGRRELREHHRQHGIITMPWSPLGRKTDLLSAPLVTGMADALDRTPAQVIMRWHHQSGHLPVPKTAREPRMRENAAFFDFTLDAEQMAALDAMDLGESAAVDSDEFGH